MQLLLFLNLIYMTLSFNIEYRTNWGEEVRVSGSIPELGNGHPSKAFPLQTIDGIHWAAEADIAVPESGYVLYSYYIFRDGYPIRAEWNSLPRTLYLSGNSKKTYRIQDPFWHTANAVMLLRDITQAC